MNEYHKIDSVYKRDERGKFILGDWAKPEFEYLKDLPWQWTEKIDGTNIRVIWEPNAGINPNVRFGGRTDNAQIPNKLVNHLNTTFTVKAFFDACFEDPITLYGEGYGAGIQSGGNYSQEQKFILFDVKIGNFWLSYENVADIANKLGIDVVWQLDIAFTLDEMIEKVQNDATTPIPSILNPKASIEGWVGTPVVPLFNRKGERIITKVKYKDFRNA